MEELHFVYINANGRIGVHSLYRASVIAKIIYQGICKNTDRIKPSEKTAFLNSTIRRTNHSGGARHFLPENYSHLTSLVRKIHSMCFLPNLKKQIKKDLVDKANEQGLTVRTSVTQSLRMLCCGYNAGYIKSIGSQG